MTLDEAIKHCKEKAEDLRTEAEQLRDIGELISNPKQPYNEPVKNCRECANEHEQLAEWLEDYKRLLEEKTQGDLISRSELKKCAIPCEIHNGALTELCIPLYQIDNAPTVEYPFYQEAYQTGYEEGKNERPQGEYVDISKLRLMTVEECAGHTIDYAMGWKACVEWIKKGGAE